MPAIGTIIRTLLMLLAGYGTAQAADKYLPGRVPGYESILPPFRPLRVAWFLGIVGAGALAWNVINRKFHIITRRHSPKRKRSRRRKH